MTPLPYSVSGTHALHLGDASALMYIDASLPH